MGGTLKLIYDIKESLKKFGAECHFRPFSLGLPAPPPWLETALRVFEKIQLFHFFSGKIKLSLDQGQHGGRFGKILVVKILKPLLDFNPQSEAEPPHTQTELRRRDTELPQPSKLPLPSHI